MNSLSVPECRHFSNKKLPNLIFSAMLYSTCSSIAMAQEITDSTSTPVTTNSNDIEISDSGSINLEDQDGVVGVTVNSSNDVIVDGIIDIEDSNNSRGIYVQPGLQSSISVTGTISLVEDYTRSDDDDDGDLDGDIAIGSDRIGILLDSGGTNTGDVHLDYGSILSVEGNDSSAITLGSNLDGNYVQDGSISVFGQNSKGLDFQGDVTGDIRISGSVQASGQSAEAVSIKGDIDGGLNIESSIAATGFTSTLTSNYISPDFIDEDTPALEDRLDADDLYSGGPAFTIGGSITNGILVNGFHDYVDDGVDVADDETKDTIDDFNENRTSGSISSYGSSPALLISADGNGAADSDIFIGLAQENVRDTFDDDDDEDIEEIIATFNFDYGLVNLGSISGVGQNVGFSSNAVTIAGSSDGNYKTYIENGIQNSGTMSATAYGADAIAVKLENGAVIPSIYNDGAITATTIGQSGNQATAIQILSGAELETITNTGTIRSLAQDDEGSSIAIQDLSGSLTHITNLGLIQAYYSDDDSTDDEYDDDDNKISEFVGSTIALDFSTNNASQGVTVVQGSTWSSGTTYIAGDILFGAGDDVLDIRSGSVISNTYFGDGMAQFILGNAGYVGELHFESENFSFQSTQGSFRGIIDFNNYAGSAIFENASYFSGSIENSANIDVIVEDSDIFFTQDIPTSLNSLNMSGDSTLGIVISQSGSEDEPYINVAQDVILGENVVFKSEFTDFIGDDFSRTILSAANLTSSLDTLNYDQSNISWLYNGELVTEENDDGLQTLSLKFSLKTPEELGLNTRQEGAYDAVVELLGDNNAGSSFVLINDQESFFEAYDSFLPHYNDASLRHLDLQTSTLNSMVAERMSMLRQSSALKHGYWLQQTFTHTSVDDADEFYGYSGRGLGLTAGYDQKLGFIDNIGVTLSVADERFERSIESDSQNTSTNISAGLYAAERLGFVDLQLSALLGKVNFNTEREVALAGLTSTIEGDWDGTTQAYSALIGTENKFGNFVVRPKLGINYVKLSQDAYDETSTNGLNLSYSAAESDKLTSSVGLSLGYFWPSQKRSTSYQIPTQDGEGNVSQKQEKGWYGMLDLGWKDTLSANQYSTTANYVGYDTLFEVNSLETFEEAFTAGVSLVAVSDNASVRFSANSEFSDTATSLNGTTSLRFQF